MKVSIISFTLRGIELSLKIKMAFSREAEEDPGKCHFDF